MLSCFALRGTTNLGRGLRRSATQAQTHIRQYMRYAQMRGSLPYPCINRPLHPLNSSMNHFFSTATGKFAILLTYTRSFVMPAVIEQVNKMSAEEKLRLIAYIVESMTGEASRSASPTSGEQWRNGYPRPRVSDFIGYCQKFNHETRSTDEIMKELREGEE